MPADGYLARKDYGDAVAGDVNAVYSSGQASGALQSLIENYGSGNAMLVAPIPGPATPCSRRGAGGATWTFGLKGSDSGESFTCPVPASLGSNDVLVADTKQVVVQAAAVAAARPLPPLHPQPLPVPGPPSMPATAIRQPVPRHPTAQLGAALLSARP